MRIRFFNNKIVLAVFFTVLPILLFTYRARERLSLGLFYYLVETALTQETNDFFADFSPHKDEILDLLGKNDPKQYIVLLMNTAEKKPDGGFFGSYALVNISPTDWSVEFFDAYYPQTVKQATQPLPSRATNIFDVPDVAFLGANNLGFTSLDGRNITALYEETFETKLDGVIFLKSSLFHELIDDFARKQRRRQFLNATVDMRRWENLPDKKRDFFNEAQGEISWLEIIHIAQKIMKNASELAKKEYVRIYLPEASDKLNKRLDRNGLTNEYSPQKIYSFDYNLGFNKIDSFIDKQMTLRGTDGERLTTGGDFLYTPTAPWNYQLGITYHWNVTEEYKGYIAELTREYNIALTLRENTILMMKPQRNNQTIVYLPPQAENIKSTTRCSAVRQFSTPFAKALKCTLYSGQPRFSKNLMVEFSLN